MNRYFFEVNRAFDELLLKPIAEIYHGALPQGVQDSIRNFFRNFDAPRTFIHDLAQGEVDRAGQTFGRFTTNTLVGVGGLFDVAAGDNPGGKGGIPYHHEDLGQTLAVWGVAPGPYLFLPLLGPSNPRDLAGRVGDMFLNPLGYGAMDKDTYNTLVLLDLTLGGIDTRARLLQSLSDVETSSIDLYATIRSLYRQRRQMEISNGRQSHAASEPNISLDEE